MVKRTKEGRSRERVTLGTAAWKRMLVTGTGAEESMEMTTTSTSGREGGQSRAKWNSTRKLCLSNTVTGSRLPERGRDRAAHLCTHSAWSHVTGWAAAQTELFRVCQGCHFTRKMPWHGLIRYFKNNMINVIYKTEARLTSRNDLGFITPFTVQTRIRTKQTPRTHLA